MSIDFANIKWPRVILGVVIAFVIAYGSSVVIVTGYSTILAFQAQGAPDTAAINAFAAQYAGIVTSIFIGVGTLVGGLLTGRKAQADALQNGLMVGVITAVLDIILSIFGGFSLWSIVSIALALAGGWLGGKLSHRHT
jgi:hypothetical protein